MSPTSSMIQHLSRFEPYEFSYGPDLPSGVVRCHQEIDWFIGWYAKHPEFAGVRIDWARIRVADGKLFGFEKCFSDGARGVQGYEGPPGPETDQQRADRERLERLEREAKRQMLAKAPMPSCHLMLNFSLECSTAVFEKFRPDLEKALKNRSLPAQPAFETIELTKVEFVPIGYRIRPEMRSTVHAAFMEAQLDTPSLCFRDFLKSDNSHNLFADKWVEKMVSPLNSDKCFYRCQESTSVPNGKTCVRFTLMASSLSDERNLEALSLFLGAISQP